MPDTEAISGTGQAQEPVTGAHGDALVSYLPGAEIEVAVAVGGQSLYITERHARDLWHALGEVFGGDPR